MRNRVFTALPAKAPAPPRTNFRRRYDSMEKYRAVLVARLASLGATAQRHPAYDNAFKLVNDTFRRSKLHKRLAVLQAAAWLIQLLEKLTAAGAERAL